MSSNASSRRREYQRLWVLRNPGKVAAYRATRRLLHGDEDRAHQLRWIAEHQERHREHMRKHQQQRRRKGIGPVQLLRRAVLAAYGGKCVTCGFADSRALQVDHVKGGGHAEMKKLGTYQLMKKQLAEAGSGEYQLLCANCNSIKRHERREFFKSYREVDGVVWGPGCSDTTANEVTAPNAVQEALAL